MRLHIVQVFGWFRKKWKIDNWLTRRHAKTYKTLFRTPSKLSAFAEPCRFAPSVKLSTSYTSGKVYFTLICAFGTRFHTQITLFDIVRFSNTFEPNGTKIRKGSLVTKSISGLAETCWFAPSVKLSTSYTSGEIYFTLIRAFGTRFHIHITLFDIVRFPKHSNQMEQKSGRFVNDQKHT